MESRDRTHSRGLYSDFMEGKDLYSIAALGTHVLDAWTSIPGFQNLRKIARTGLIEG